MRDLKLLYNFDKFSFKIFNGKIVTLEPGVTKIAK